MATGTAADKAAQQGEQKEQQRDEDKGPGSVSGNLTKDPDLRYTNNGRPVTSLRLANSERVRDEATGQWGDGPVSYYDVQAWGQLAENVCESLQKGDRVVAEGRWAETHWVDKEDMPQSRVYLNARDLGPSMIFRGARPVRKDGK
jgi:single-strand DNA-binding protein